MMGFLPCICWPVCSSVCRWCLLLSRVSLGTLFLEGLIRLCRLSNFFKIGNIGYDPLDCLRDLQDSQISLEAVKITQSSF